MGIIQQRTRTQMIFIKRLALLISLKQGRTKCFQQRNLLYIDCRIMNESTRFDIPIGIDMEIITSSGDTSPDILPVIPEIHSKDRLCLTEHTYLLVHEFPLFGSHHQFGYSIVTDRHISEIPNKSSPLVDHKIKIFRRPDDIDVFTMITSRHTE